MVTARNKGIEAARGKYVGFVDADDWIQSDMYEKMLVAMHEVDLVCTSYVVYDGDKKIVRYEYSKCGRHSGRYELDSMYGDMLQVDGNVGVITVLWNKLFRMDLIKKVYKKVDTSMRLAEDCVLVYMYRLRCKNINIIDAKCYHHIRWGNTASYKKDIAFLSNMDKMYQCMYREFESNSHREELMKQLNNFIINALKNQLLTQKIMPRTFYYPYFGRLDNKKIVLYGAGNVGQSFYRDITEHEKDVVDIVLWTDTSYENYNEGGTGLCNQQPGQNKRS